MPFLGLGFGREAKGKPRHDHLLLGTGAFFGFIQANRREVGAWYGSNFPKDGLWSTWEQNLRIPQISGFGFPTKPQ